MAPPQQQARSGGAFNVREQFSEGDNKQFNEAFERSRKMTANDRGYGEVGINFLNSNKKVDNIITNPPFNLSTEFTIKALNLANKSTISMIQKIEGMKK